MNLEEVKLEKGSHESREKGMCAMEFVAYLAGEPHGDKPQCASPLITSFVISCNDRWTDEERQLLKPYLPRIMGTRDGKDLDRAKLFAMAAVTKISPIAIELIGFKDEAQKMRDAKTLEEGIVAAEYAAESAEYAASAAKHAKYAESAEYAASAAKHAKYAESAAEYAASAAYAAEYAEYAAKHAKYAESAAEYAASAAYAAEYAASVKYAAAFAEYAESAAEYAASAKSAAIEARKKIILECLNLLEQVIEVGK